jgi:hypothetical protein
MVGDGWAVGAVCDCRAVPFDDGWVVIRGDCEASAWSVTAAPLFVATAGQPRGW